MTKAVLFALCVVACGSLGLQASMITVINPGFESDILGPGGSTNNAFAAGWTCTTQIAFGCGAFHATAAQYPGGVPDGVNVAYSNGGTIAQTLAATLALNMTYTLTVDVGQYQGFTSYLIELLAGSTVVASDNTTLHPSAGTFLLSTVVYNSGAVNALAGQALTIRLTGNSGGQPNFDSVALNAVTTVPEPSAGTFGLIGLGLICARKLHSVLARR